MLRFDFNTYTNKYQDKELIEKLNNQKQSIITKLKTYDMTGWLDYHLDNNTLTDIISTANYIKENFDSLIVIAIGGSYMGTYALDNLFKKYFNNDRFEIIYAGWNLSNKYLNELLEYINNKNVAINVISKSGTTMEPSIAYEKIMEKLKDKYSSEELIKRVFITTDANKGSLREEVNKNGYKSFIVPGNIGGRYSILTPVGLLPLATIIDIKELLKGAETAKKYLDDAYNYAVLRYNFYKINRVVENYCSYEPNMLYFLEWLKQLFGETEGKNNKGILPTSSIYTRDLHSLGQFIQEGNPIEFETVLKQEDSGTLNNLVLDSVCTAHYNHTPSIIITMDKINEYTIGELIYFFFCSAAISGLLFDINPFNQPGVEKYKEEVKRRLGEKKDEK